MSLASCAEKEANRTWSLIEISRPRESFRESGTHFYRVKFPNPALCSISEFLFLGVAHASLCMLHDVQLNNVDEKMLICPDS